MKKIQKKNPKHTQSVLSRLNDNPDQSEKAKKGLPEKKKGMLSKLNDDPAQKK